MSSHSPSNVGVKIPSILPGPRPQIPIAPRVPSKTQEEIVTKLTYHPERLSSGELSKIHLRILSKHLGHFPSRTTFDVYLRWLEAQRLARQTSINANWKNVVMQWAQSLKARKFSLAYVVDEVQRWKKENGPFEDPKTEENARFPPVAAELRYAYEMDLKAHGARRPALMPSDAVRRARDHYEPEQKKYEDKIESSTNSRIRGEKQWCERCGRRTTSVKVHPSQINKGAKDDAYCCDNCGTLREQFLSEQNHLFSPTMSFRELNMQDTAMSPPIYHSSSSNTSFRHKTSTIGLFVMNVKQYTDDEVREIFHPDCRRSIIYLDTWLSNRTVHFRTVQDRDRAYHLLPEDIKHRKERDLGRPLVKIYSDTGNKEKTDSENGYGTSSKKSWDIYKGPDEVIGLWVMNVEDLSKMEVKTLFDERDVLNIVGMERWGKSNMLVQFHTTYLRDLALEHLSPRLKEPRNIPDRCTPLVTLFHPKLRGNRGTVLNEDSSRSPDKFYSTREDVNDNRSFSSFAKNRRQVSREEHSEEHGHNERDCYIHPSRREQVLDQEIPQDDETPCKDEFVRSEPPIQESHKWKEGYGELFATMWLEKLGEEIMEQRMLGNDINIPSELQAQALKANLDHIEDLHTELRVQEFAEMASTIFEGTFGNKTNVGIRVKRARGSDESDDSEYSDIGQKRLKLMVSIAHQIDGFSDSEIDEGELDCSSLDLSRVRRHTALQMWDLHDRMKYEAELAEEEINGVSEDEQMGAVEENSSSDEVKDVQVVEAEHDLGNEAGNDPEVISSPEDGWCSSRDYLGGSSDESDDSEPKDSYDNFGQPNLPADYEPHIKSDSSDGQDIDMMEENF